MLTSIDKRNLKRLTQGIWGMTETLDYELPDIVIEDLLRGYRTLTAYYCKCWQVTLQNIDKGIWEGEREGVIAEHNKAVRYYKMVNDVLKYGIQERLDPKKRKKRRATLNDVMKYIEGDK